MSQQDSGDESFMSSRGYNRGEPHSKRQKVEGRHNPPTTMTDPWAATMENAEANIAANTVETQAIPDAADLDYLVQPEVESALQYVGGPVTVTGVGLVAPVIAAELAQPPAQTPAPPRPAFSYRAEAAQQHQYPVAPAHSADTYDYTDEGEFALERALAAIGQSSEVVRPPVEEPPCMDTVSMYHELELGFNLGRCDDGDAQLLSDPPSVEYSENGARLQSELFELGQSGFTAQDLSSMVDSLVGPGDNTAPASAGFEAELLPSVEQPGPSRPRAHAVQLYPRGTHSPLQANSAAGGEGEPHTCYITNLPKLEIEPTFYAEGSPMASPVPLLAQPVSQPASQSAEMLEALLRGAPGDDDISASSSPPQLNTSEYSSEPDEETEPVTIAEALRSAAISIAALVSDDSQNAENRNAEYMEDLVAAPVIPTENNDRPSVIAGPMSPSENDALFTDTRLAATIAIAPSVDEVTVAKTTPDDDSVSSSVADDSEVASVSVTIAGENEAVSVANTTTAEAASETISPIVDVAVIALAEDNDDTSAAVTSNEDNDAASGATYPTVDVVTVGDTSVDNNSDGASETVTSSETASETVTPSETAISLEDNEAASVIISSGVDDVKAARISTPIDGNEADFVTVIPAMDIVTGAEAFITAEDNVSASVADRLAGDMEAPSVPAVGIMTVAEAIAPAASAAVTPAVVNVIAAEAIIPAMENESDSVAVIPIRDIVTSSMTVPPIQDKLEASVAITPTEDKEPAAGAAVEPVMSKPPKKSAASKKGKRKSAATAKPETTATRKPKKPKKVRPAVEVSTCPMVLRSRHPHI